MDLEVRSKVPLRWAAQLLTNLCDEIDASPNLSKSLEMAFQEANIGLAESIDRRKAVLWAISGSLKAARGARDELDAYVQKLKAIKKSIELDTKEAMILAPDLPWKDSMGRKLTLCNNSSPKVLFPFDVKEKRSFSNLVHDETIRMFEIPKRFLKGILITSLDMPAIKQALKDGEKLSWADLELGKQVRGLKPKDEADDDE